MPLPVFAGRNGFTRSADSLALKCHKRIRFVVTERPGGVESAKVTATPRSWLHGRRSLGSAHGMLIVNAKESEEVFVFVKVTLTARM